METTRKSLLLRIRDPRDSVAWQEFDGIYRPILTRYTKAWHLRDADIEDVVQHCMVAVHKRVESFDYDPDRGRFKSWLRTLANNRIRNLFRDRRMQEAKSADFERPQLREPPPDQQFDKLWMDEHLKHCMGQVRTEVEPTTFKAFELHVYEQWPVERVCSTMNMTPNQVYKIKRRVTQMVAQKMRMLLQNG